LLIILLIFLLLIGTMIIRIRHGLSGHFFEGAFLPFQLLLSFALYMVYKRRAVYQNLLQSTEPEHAIANLEKWVQNEYTVFRSTDMIRLILGAATAIGFLLLLFFKPQSNTCGALFIGFLGLISLSMLKSWTLMRDGINVQDLKHCVRDQTSEIS
jgi:hypothetical protein